MAYENKDELFQNSKLLTVACKECNDNQTADNLNRVLSLFRKSMIVVPMIAALTEEEARKRSDPGAELVTIDPKRFRPIFSNTPTGLKCLVVFSEESIIPDNLYPNAAPNEVILNFIGDFECCFDILKNANIDSIILNLEVIIIPQMIDAMKRNENIVVCE